MKVVRGRTLIVESTVFIDRPTVADLTGATIKAMFKASQRDADGDAIFVKDATITDAAAGLCRSVLSAAETLTITQNKIYFEVVAKLADGTFISGGIEELEVSGNLLKTLF